MQPTVPIRKNKTIKKLILKLRKNKKYDSAASVCSVGASHPFRMKVFRGKFLKNFINLKKENMKPRQDLPKVYIRSGSLYMIRREALLKYNSMVGKKVYGIVLTGHEATNIDTLDDLNYLKMKLKNA